jgi:gliotoxin/aspirochlorine biosynthesis thioredoxin reductase
MSCESRDDVDVLIIGGGPSGLAATLCLSRALYKTAVFDSGEYRNEASRRVHMLPTWDHKDPREYREAARLELQTRYKTVTFVVLKVTGGRWIILRVLSTQTS